MNIIKQLREQAEEISRLGYYGWGNTMTIAADKLELYEAQLWAINDELIKAGLKPMEYDSFAECIATLRERAQIEGIRDKD